MWRRNRRLLVDDGRAPPVLKPDIACSCCIWGITSGPALLSGPWNISPKLKSNGTQFWCWFVPSYALSPIIHKAEKWLQGLQMKGCKIGPGLSSTMSHFHLLETMTWMGAVGAYRKDIAGIYGSRTTSSEVHKPSGISWANPPFWSFTSNIFWPLFPYRWPTTQIFPSLLGGRWCAEVLRWEIIIQDPQGCIIHFHFPF